MLQSGSRLASNHWTNPKETFQVQTLQLFQSNVSDEEEIQGQCQKTFLITYEWAKLTIVLTHKHQARLDWLARDKHFSLFGAMLVTKEKKIIRFTRRANATKFLHNLRMVQISQSVCPWQPSLIFVSNVGANPCGVPRVGSWPYPLTLDEAQEA